MDEKREQIWVTECQRELIASAPAQAAEIERLRNSIEDILNVGLSAISYVESANYDERAKDARASLIKAVNNALKPGVMTGGE